MFSLVSSIVSLNPVAPGKPQRVVADLKTGEFILDAAEHVDGPTPPDAKRITHVFKAEKVVGTVEPKADVSVELKDFALILPDEVKAGKHVWKVSNAGKQWHMFLVAKPNAGASSDDVLKALTEQSPSGPPPFEVIGGVSPMSEGERQWVEMDLQPGTYVLACPLPDLLATGGAPMSHVAHVAHGMHRILVVK